MSELGFNVWGAIGSAVGILTLIPLFLAWLQPRLPRSMLPSIMETHKEVKELLATALSQGLITDPVDLHQLHINMIDANIRVDEVRAEVYRIKSWTQDAGKWWSGLSARMYILRNDLNSTRIQLAERNSQELKSLASLGLAGRLAGIPARKEDCDPHLPAVRPEIARSGSEKGHEASTLSEEHAAAIKSVLLGAHSPSWIPPPLQRKLHGEIEGAGDCLAPQTNYRGIDAAGDSDDPSLTPQHQQRRVPTLDPPHHLVSDSELRDLMSLALAHPNRSSRQTKRSRLSTVPRPASVHNASKRLRGSSSAPEGRGDAIPAKRHALPSRLRSLRHLIRRVYGVQLGHGGVSKSAGTDVSVALEFDPESLTSRNTEEGDSDDDSDGWEECQ